MNRRLLVGAWCVLINIGTVLGMENASSMASSDFKSIAISSEPVLVTNSAPSSVSASQPSVLSSNASSATQDQSSVKKPSPQRFTWNIPMPVAFSAMPPLPTTVTHQASTPLTQSGLDVVELKKVAESTHSLSSVEVLVLSMRQEQRQCADKIKNDVKRVSHDLRRVSHNVAQLHFKLDHVAQMQSLMLQMMQQQKRILEQLVLQQEVNMNMMVYPVIEYSDTQNTGANSAFGSSDKSGH